MASPSDDNEQKLKGCWARRALFVFGWFNVVLGAIGVVIPGLPTTVFLIIALWAFSKSSDRFHNWLWNHPRFGQSLQNWHSHRVIPVRAKLVAVSMMSMSYLFLVVYVADDWTLPLLMAAIMLPAAGYVVTRASKVFPASKEQFTPNP